MAKTWKDADISLEPIKNQTIAVIGYGIQGDAQANNMKDSGLNVIIGLKEGGKSWSKAVSDGHKVMSVADATKQADIIHILIPDMIQGKIFKEEIGPNLSEGKALSFSHSAAIYWKWIEAPSNVDLIMVAPKGPGSKVRETYLDNFGTPSIVAVAQKITTSV
jgi:ketol-acid reductoisomerase